MIWTAVDVDAGGSRLASLGLRTGRVRGDGAARPCRAIEQGIDLHQPLARRNAPQMDRIDAQRNCGSAIRRAERIGHFDSSIGPN